MTVFSDRLYEALSMKGWTYSDLSKATGLSTGLISQWNTGKVVHPTAEKIKIIARALNVNADWLVGEDVLMTRSQINLTPPEILKDADLVTFPILGEVAAGFDTPPMESWEGASVALPKHFLKGRSPEDFFALKVIGDSMYPVYMENDIVLVLKQSALRRSGDIGVIIYDSEYASIKKVEFDKEWMRLVPINPTHKPITIEGSDLERCRILGIPKLLIREIEQ